MEIRRYGRSGIEIGVDVDRTIKVRHTASPGRIDDDRSTIVDGQQGRLRSGMWWYTIPGLERRDDTLGTPYPP